MTEVTEHAHKELSLLNFSSLKFRHDAILLLIHYFGRKV